MTVISKYLEWLNAQEWRAIARAMVPPGIWQLRNFLRYRSWHPDAFISSDSIVAREASLGRNSIIRKSHVGPTARIGKYTTIGDDGMINGGATVTIGDYCSIGPDSFFWSENHNPKTRSHYPFRQMRDGVAGDSEYAREPIVVGNDVWIGTRVTILAGAQIGDGCIVAAGSVVKAGVYEPYSLIAGVPGKVVRSRFEESERAELCELRWWEKEEDEIFGSLLSHLQEEAE